MKSRILALLAVASVSLSGFASSAAEAQPTAATPEVTAASELKTLVSKIQDKLKEAKDKPKEEALATELKEFETLLARHKDQKTDEVAQIRYMQAMLYLQVLENPDKAKELVQKMKQEFPETRQGRTADTMLKSIDEQAQAAKVRKELVEGKPFPDFQEKDLEGKPLSISAYKGKVVLVDFWATWCGPCVRELPNVLDTYKQHHEKGFEIIGISLDTDEAKLKKFIEDNKMPWVQYFDGKGWDSKLGKKYGVASIPATYLLDREGKIIAKDLRGEELETAVAKALGQ